MDPGIIGLDITAVIGLSLLGVAVLLGAWTLWLVLQTTLVCSGAGMRYHRVYVRDSRQAVEISRAFTRWEGRIMLV